MALVENVAGIDSGLLKELTVREERRLVERTGRSAEMHRRAAGSLVEYDFRLIFRYLST